MPVEQIRAGRPREQARGPSGIDRPSPRRSGPPRRCRVPQAVCELACQAHRPQSLRPQRADRDRQLRGRSACARGSPAVGRSFGTRARRCRVGAGPTLRRRTARDASERAPRAGGRAARGGGMDGSAAGGRLMTTLVCLGLGYCARHYVSTFGARFDCILGTTRNADHAAALGKARPGGKSVDMLLFDGTSASGELRAAILAADALLVSAAPTEDCDPVLVMLEGEIAQAARLKSVVYLSSLGVYGDSGGAWIDETAPTIPARARRGGARIAAEIDWQGIGRKRNLPVAIEGLRGVFGAWGT